MASTISSGAPPTVPLPLEVVEKILKEVDDLGDRQSLLNCSYVSKLFLYLCRAHLFRHLKLFLDPNQSERGGGSNDTKSPQNQLIAFLVSEPHVTSLIRTIHITGADPHPQTTTAQWTTVIEDLSKLPPKLTQLRHLVIESAFFTDWTMFRPELRNVLHRLHCLPTLQHLELHYMLMSTQELLSLARIPEVTLIGVASTPSEGVDAINNASQSPFVRSILHNLKIVLKGSNTNNFLPNLIKAAAETLKSLEWLSNPYQEMEITNLHSIPLRDLGALVFLSIFIPLDDSGIRDIVDLFGTANGAPNKSKLEHINVLCDYRQLPDKRIIDEWNWQGIDEALATYAVHGTLRTLNVSVKKFVHPKHKQLSKEVYEHMIVQSLTLFRSKLPMVLEKGVSIDSGMV